ncbi:MAG: ROK family protein [Chthoniobacterales bacterium]
MSKDFLLGIDLGGTKIEAALVPRNDPARAHCRLRVPTEQEKGYRHILSQIKKLCSQVEEETGVPLPDVIGLGHPGTLDPHTRKIKCSNTQALQEKPLQEDLSALLGRKLVVENDANCFALAEALLGAAKNFRLVFGVILGTGVGGGIVVDGRALHGCHGIAGEWGQIVLDPDGPESVYGTRGTVESYLCGPALEKFFTSLSQQKKRLPEIVQDARCGANLHAAATLNQLTDKFSEAISLVINLLDPDAVVVGGGVGNIDEIYSAETLKKIDKRIFQSQLTTKFLRPQLGDSAGVFGAALLTK